MKSRLFKLILLKRALTYILLLFVSISITNAQDIPSKGVPALRNFMPSEYDNKGKVWSIDSAPNGLVYMASDNGLLEYDGKKWKNFEGSDGITRSVYVKSDSIIFTGSDLDFGIWKKDGYQNFNYTSLYPFKEELNEINEGFWEIHSLDENIIFISSYNIYVFKDDNLTKLPAPDKINNSFQVGNDLYFIDEKRGLFLLENLTPKAVFNFGEKLNNQIIGIYLRDSQMVLVTKQEGLFEFKTDSFSPINNQLSQKIKKANVFSFEEINDTYYSFGTILEGVFISDEKGEIIHHVDKSKGLQNNTVLSQRYSNSGQLWLGMDYGVSYLDLSSAFTFFYDFRGEFGTGYNAVIKDENFYLGTNQALYKTNWENLNNKAGFNDFELVPNTEGQVWTLETINENTWVGHDKGLFTLNDNGVQKINDETGYWDVQPYKEFLLTGTYNGISVFTNKDGSWEFSKKMDLIVGSCNQIKIEKENTLWVNIPKYGIIKATLDKDLNPINRKIFLSDKFKGDDHFIVQKNDSIYIQTSTQMYYFDETSNEFVAKSSEDYKTKIEEFLLPNAHPVKLDNDFEFYPVYNGFALKELNMENARMDNSSNELVIRSLEGFNNENSIQVHDGSKIPFTHNNLRVEVIVPNRKDVSYQYKLEENENWSVLRADNVFELFDLKHGDLDLFIRAYVNGITTRTVRVSINIASPWYLSIYAYALYLLLTLSLIYSFYKWRQISLKKLKKNLLLSQQNSLREQADRYNERLKRVEEENLRLEYDQLKSQLKNKTIELATKAKENEEINKVLEELKEKFKKLEQNPDSLKSRTKEIQNIIDSHLSSDDNTFEIQMDELHQQFFENLRQNYPDLTNYDLRLCAYLKLGFNSKEIANMLNIMPSSIYISRSRLRKKLNLDSESDLHGFLNSI